LKLRSHILIGLNALAHTLNSRGQNSTLHLALVPTAATVMCNGHTEKHCPIKCTYFLSAREKHHPTVTEYCSSHSRNLEL